MQSLAGLHDRRSQLLLLGSGRLGLCRWRRGHRHFLLANRSRFRLLLRRFFLYRFWRSIAHGGYPFVELTHSRNGSFPESISGYQRAEPPEASLVDANLRGCLPSGAGRATYVRALLKTLTAAQPLLPDTGLVSRKNARPPILRRDDTPPLRRYSANNPLVNFLV